MSNLKHWILKAANGERIEAVLFGALEDKDALMLDAPSKGSRIANSNEVLTWAEAEKVIDHATVPAPGRPVLKAITVWTKSRVIFISQQHGTTNIEYAPRRTHNQRPKNSEH